MKGTTNLTNPTNRRIKDRRNKESLIRSIRQIRGSFTPSLFRICVHLVHLRLKISYFFQSLSLLFDPTLRHLPFLTSPRLGGLSDQRSGPFEIRYPRSGKLTVTIKSHSHHEAPLAELAPIPPVSKPLAAQKSNPVTIHVAIIAIHAWNPISRFLLQAR